MEKLPNPPKAPRINKTMTNSTGDLAHTSAPLAVDAKPGRLQVKFSVVALPKFNLMKTLSDNKEVRLF
jgi:hypothetical protein